MKTIVFVKGNEKDRFYDTLLKARDLDIPVSPVYEDSTWWWIGNYTLLTGDEPSKMKYDGDKVINHEEGTERYLLDEYRTSITDITCVNDGVLITLESSWNAPESILDDISTYFDVEVEYIEIINDQRMQFNHIGNHNYFTIPYGYAYYIETEIREYEYVNENIEFLSILIDYLDSREVTAPLANTARQLARKYKNFNDINMQECKELLGILMQVQILLGEGDESYFKIGKYQEI